MKIDDIRLTDKLAKGFKGDSAQAKFAPSFQLKDRSYNSNEKENRYEKITRRGSVEALKNSDSSSNVKKYVDLCDFT